MAMLPLRPALRQVRRSTLHRQILQPALVSRKWKSDVDNTYQPPTATPEQKADSGSSNANPHRAFYGNFGMPLLQGFLIALLTYQMTYWGWLKLESMEVRREKEGEVKSLETQIRQLTGVNKSA